MKRNSITKLTNLEILTKDEQKNLKGGHDTTQPETEYIVIDTDIV